MVIVLSKITDFFKNETGSAAIEYGLLASLISVAIIGGVTGVSSGLSDNFGKVSTAITEVP